MLIAGYTPPESLGTISGGTLKEQTWITFSGAYIGAIIGAIGAIAVMFITLNDKRKERIDNRRYTDYLYIRDKVEDVFNARDNTLEWDVLAKMNHLLIDEFTPPDLKEFRKRIEQEDKAARVMIRALKRTVIPNVESLSNELFRLFQDHIRYQKSLDEYVSFIVENCAFYLKKYDNKALLSDALYEVIVGHWSLPEHISMQMEDDLSVGFKKYSFLNVDGYSKILYCEPGVNSFSHEGVEAKTLFFRVFYDTLRFYYSEGNKLADSIGETATALFNAMKIELDS